MKAPGPRAPLIGFHCSHEQFTPRELLECAVLAEAAGFDAASCSDHIAPWSEAQGHSGFAWSWLGAALASTSLPFGVVTTPGYRYHPVILAQACATLEQMFPERFWVSTGSGEWLNEHVVGGEWPDKDRRKEILHASVEVMRALWRGETVSRREPITVHNARLWVHGERPTPVIGPALTVETAGWLGSWADGLITTNQPDRGHADLIDAFRQGGGDGKPVYIQSKVSWAETDDIARDLAFRQWRTNVFESDELADLEQPSDFEREARGVTPEQVARHVRISSDSQRHVDWLLEDAELGLAGIYLHNVGTNQREFIDMMGEHVLPALRRPGGES